MIIEVHQSDDNFEITENIVHVIEVAPFGQPDGILSSLFTAKGQLIAASGADTAVAVPASAADGYTLIADSAQTSGVRWGSATVTLEDNNNYLINGGFDLAQRQTPGTDTTIADEAYSADRWCITREAASLQYSRQDASGETGLTSRYYGKFTQITNPGKFMIFQPMEFRDSIPLRSRTMVFQLQMKASSAKTVKIAILELQAAGTADSLPAALVGAWNVDSTDPSLGANIAVVASGSCSVTTSWQTFSVSGSVPTDSKNLIIAVWTDADFSASDTLSLAEAGLYRGSSTQAWAPRPFAAELQLCRRYYWKTFATDIAPAQNVGLNTGELAHPAITAGTTTQRFASFILPVSMRGASPTATAYNPAAANAQVRDATASADCSSTAIVATNGNSLAIETVGNASTAAGNGLRVHATVESEL